MNTSKAIYRIIQSPGWILLFSLLIFQIMSFFFILNGIENAWAVGFSALTSIFWLRSNYAYMHLQRLRHEIYLHHAAIFIPQMFYSVWHVYRFLVDPLDPRFIFTIWWPLHCIIGIVYTGLVIYMGSNSGNSPNLLSHCSSQPRDSKRKSVLAFWGWSVWGFCCIIALPIVICILMFVVVNHESWILWTLQYLLVFLVSIYPNIYFLMTKSWKSMFGKALGISTLFCMFLIAVISIAYPFLSFFQLPIGIAYVVYMHNLMPDEWTQKVAMVIIPSGVFILGLLFVSILFLLNAVMPPQLFMGILIPLVPIHLLAFLFLQQVYIDHLFKKDLVS